MSLMNQLPPICLKVLCFFLQLSSCSVHWNVGSDNHMRTFVSDKCSGLVSVGQGMEED
jgi:hypothetical protein